MARPRDPRDPHDRHGRSALPDHYAALGLAPTAKASEIRAAWKAAAKQWHPDKVEGAARGEGLTNEQIAHRVAGAAIRFREARTAYDVLRSATERADYDAARVRASREAQEAAWAHEAAREAARGREREAAQWASVEADRLRWEHLERNRVERAHAAHAERDRAARDRAARADPWTRRAQADHWSRAAARATCDYIAVVTAAWGPVDPWAPGPWVRSDILLPLD